jgi:hypothetical protein
VDWNGFLLNEKSQVMPDAVWNAYWILLVAGALLGLLCGAGVLSGLGLGVFVAGAVIGFVPWAVSMIEPQKLADEPAYKNRNGASDPGER